MPETSETFSNRHWEIVVLDKVEDGKWVHQVSGGSFMLRGDAQGKVRTTVPYLLESIGGTGLGAQITGLASLGNPVTFHQKQYDEGAAVPVPQEWFWHNSDQLLAAERTEMLDNIARERRELLDRYRDEWTEREKALSEPLKARLAAFHANGGEKFELEGWGYELVVCELAELYHASGGEDSPEVMELADREGTSGNQHSFAKALACALTEDPAAIKGSVSALTPLTGDPHYKK